VDTARRHLELARGWRKRRPRRRLYRFINSEFKTKFGVHDTSVDTLRSGLLTRVFVSKYQVGGELSQPAVAPLEVVFEIMREAEQKFKKLSVFLTPWTIDQFVESRRRKRAVYERAGQVLKTRGLRKSDAYLSTFVKAEKLNLTNKPDPDPRVIQPRGPAFNVAVGRYLSRLEPLIYRSLADMWGHTVVFKGVNAGESGRLMREKWEMYSSPIAFGIDVHRFDQHVSTTLLKWEHRIYDLYFRSRRLRDLLKSQLQNRGFGRCPDGEVFYTVDGCRCSGDMNTSLGNCLLVCAALYAARARSGLDFNIANNGDDCIIFCNAGDEPAVRAVVLQVFETLCMPLAAEPAVDRFERISFCQTQPVETCNGWTMVRDPRTAMDKDLCSLKPIRNEAEWNTLRNSVGVGGRALAGNVPIWGPFYTMLSRGAGVAVDQDSTETGFKHLARGMDGSGPITDECRISFMRAYGIPPSVQLAVEEHLLQLVPTWAEPANGEGGVLDSEVGAAMGSLD